MFPTWSIQKTFPLSFPSYLHFCCVSHRNNTQWRTSKSWASTKKTVKWFNFKKGNELQRAEQILKKTVKWFNFKKGTINLITLKFASSLSFVLKNKTKKKRNCEKYSQTYIGRLNYSRLWSISELSYFMNLDGFTFLKPCPTNQTVWTFLTTEKSKLKASPFVNRSHDVFYHPSYLLRSACALISTFALPPCYKHSNLLFMSIVGMQTVLRKGVSPWKVT